jgi:Gpi18-like mannosyltransferase
VKGLNISVVSSIVAWLLSLLLLAAIVKAGYILLEQMGVIKPFRLFKKQGIAAERMDLLGRLASFFGIKLSSNVKLVIKIGGIVIISRLIIYLFGYFAIMLTQNQADGFFSAFQSRWYKVDSLHFVNIARQGYVNYGDDRLQIVFYPLYPFLIKLIGFIVQDLFLAGVIVSTLSLITACVYIYKLALLEFNDKEIAFNSMKFLLIFPLSFFLGLVFSDALFLTLTIATFYYLRKQKWFLAGLFGGLASLTRNFGILLLVPAIIEYLEATKFTDKLKTKNWKQIFMDFAIRGSNLLFIVLGQVVYLAINKVVTGDWFTFVKYQNENWKNGFSLNIVNNLTTYIYNIFDWGPADSATMWIPLAFLVVVTIWLVFYAMRKIRLSYIAYTLAYLFICLCATWLISFPRYALGLFPVYIILALLAAKSRTNNFWITLVSALALCCYTLAYAMGLSIF